MKTPIENSIITPKVMTLINQHPHPMNPTNYAGNVIELEWYKDTLTHELNELQFFKASALYEQSNATVQELVDSRLYEHKKEILKCKGEIAKYLLWISDYIEWDFRNGRLE